MSYAYHYKGRDDYEVIVVEDSKRTDEFSEWLSDVIYEYSKYIRIRHLIYNNDNNYCPASIINHGVLNARGEYAVLTCPECVHIDNILAGMDEEFNNNTDAYVVAACANVSFAGKAESFEVLASIKPGSWRQHTKHENTFLYWCAALSRKNFWGLGGLDQMYSAGISTEDTDFVKKIKQMKMTIVPRDDLVVYHIDHERGFDYSRNKNGSFVHPLVQRNHTISAKKWNP
jgi:hypothetical protein